MNRTLVETTRSMLGYSKLPPKFWAEALSTAVYLRNRNPTKAVEGMTPFEAWVGEKPNVGHLRTFGCVVYAHVAKDERNKLDTKARKCIFMGYSTDTKGYRLYDPKCVKVFSRDVVFNEKQHGIEKNRYVQIECLGNDEQVDEDKESHLNQPLKSNLSQSYEDQQGRDNLQTTTVSE